MGKNTWKVIGIISIVINILFLAGFVWAMNLGNESIDNERNCYYDFCDVDNIESPAYNYHYDEYNEVCYCYNEYNEIIQETYLG